MITSPEPLLLQALAGVFACLLTGSVFRFIALRKSAADTRRKRLQSLRTWWLLALAVSAGLVVGRLGVCVLLAVASCLGWWELTRMAGLRQQDSLAVRAGYLLIAGSYLLVLTGSVSLFPVFIPVLAPLVLAISLLVKDDPKGYIRSGGFLLWALLFLGYGIPHAAYLMVLPASAAGPLGPAGWFLFVVILTETDDIMQAVVGRRFGAGKKHRITPVVSPNKTWEGFFGGMLAIVVLAPLIAPWLTTLGQQPGPLGVPSALQPIVAPVLAAILISIAGFFGDINMSAIKRDSGVKDSSNLLPGMGGIIDRVDSLTMTAPVFVYFLLWWVP